MSRHIPLGFAFVLVALITPPAAAQVQADIVIAQAIEDREPVGASSTFAADVGRVAAWTRISGAANSTIEHVWRHAEHEFVVPLTIGGSPWRTWSTKVIPVEWTGEWTFEVRDATGTVVATETFTVGQP